MKRAYIKRHAAAWKIVPVLGVIMASPAFQGCAQTSNTVSNSEEEAFLRQGEAGELLRAAADGNVFKVDKLLSAGANVNARTPDGATALMGAVYYGYPQTSRLLMERGADVNATTDDGVTALHYAAQQGHSDIARDLLQKGADPDAVSAAGNTPLQLAQAAGHQEVAELLQQMEEPMAPDQQSSR
jgi:ankyrin repeat protein